MNLPKAILDNYKTVTGENYALICGDCLEVMKMMEAGSVDFIFADPPYGHNNNNNGDLIARWEAALGRGDYIAERDDRPIENDGEEANEVYKSSLPEMFRVLSPGCCCCCCCGGGPDPQFARWSLWMDKIFQFKQMIVWDKGPMGMGWHYRRSYETILVGEVPGAACRWYDNTKRVENIIRPGNGISKIIPSSNQHPTEKPIELSRHFINLHSKIGDLILDPFMGSGTTGVACMQTGRKFIGIEINPDYFAIAERRIREAAMQPPLFIENPKPPDAIQQELNLWAT